MFLARPIKSRIHTAIPTDRSETAIEFQSNWNRALNLLWHSSCRQGCTAGYRQAQSADGCHCQRPFTILLLWSENLGAQGAQWWGTWGKSVRVGEKRWHRIYWSCGNAGTGMQVRGRRDNQPEHMAGWLPDWDRSFMASWSCTLLAVAKLLPSFLVQEFVLVIYTGGNHFKTKPNQTKPDVINKAPLYNSSRTSSLYLQILWGSKVHASITC